MRSKKVPTLLVALGISLVGNLNSRAATADGYYWTDDQRASCSKDHRVRLVLGSTTLEVDMRAVMSVVLGNSAPPSDLCLTDPIEARKVIFSQAHKEIALLYKEMSLPLFWLSFETGSEASVWRLPFPGFSKRKQIIEGIGVVEDVTDRVVVDARPIVRSRAYLLQHADAPFNQQPILLVCEGEPSLGAVRRDCSAEYIIKPGLVVRYVMRQDARDMLEKNWQIPPSGSIEEPLGLFQIDRGVREFLRRLELSS